VWIERAQARGQSPDLELERRRGRLQARIADFPIDDDQLLGGGERRQAPMVAGARVPQQLVELMQIAIQVGRDEVVHAISRLRSAVIRPPRAYRCASAPEAPPDARRRRNTPRRERAKTAGAGTPTRPRSFR